MRDFCGNQIRSGHIRIYAKDDPSYVVLDQKNVICDSSRGLFARFIANLAEPSYGCWGLAVGAGAVEWANSSPLTPPPAPDPDNTPFRLYNQLARKPLSLVRFLDANDQPALGGTQFVELQTIINSATDNLVAPLMEMGLIGGGTKSANGGLGTNMQTAPFWSPDINDPDSVVLINYTTFGALQLPPKDFVISWTLAF